MNRCGLPKRAVEAAAALVLLNLAASAAVGQSAPERTSFKFDFSPGKAAPGFLRVAPATACTADRGFGFELGSGVTAVNRGGDEPLRDGFCTDDAPFFFSVSLPEGNYTVTATFGDRTGASTNTVKAESRRLMLERVATAPGQFVTRSFTVNVRTPKIATGGQVRLKNRESGPPLVLHWDDKLTLEFNGARPALCAVEIAPATNAITVYLAGDSTVTDQPLEPWNSWGQMLPRFFTPAVAVANHAESGETLKSFLGAHRLDKIVGSIRPGDYLFIQFGHNDQKDKSPGAGAFTTYQTNLLRFVAEARQRGAQPVLVTSMERKAGVSADTLGDFPTAVRQVAKDQDVPLIDLHTMSQTLYAAMGSDLGKAFQDGTHHTAYGSYELARCVVEGIQANKLGLAKFLAEDVAPFDPHRPDPVEQFDVPASPESSTRKPEGN